MVKNAKALAEALRENGIKVYGTENHLMVVEVDLKKVRKWRWNWKTRDSG